LHLTASWPPHGLAAGSEAHHHDEALVHYATTTCGHLGVAANYDLILEQLHPLALPPIAPYTSNETLVRVQLGLHNSLLQIQAVKHTSTLE
ncbi:unnamed protein product, partial [Prunus brigantina]